MPSVFSRGPLEGLVIVQPRIFTDERGDFFETYKRSEYAAGGIAEDFVQDNHSVSAKGVLRGLHFQREPHAQGKLVRVVTGAVWDVAVDLRPDSPTYRQWFGLELSGHNRTQFYIPPGFGHGFLALSDSAHFVYKCTAEYDKDSEGGVRWDDPALSIGWPVLDGGYTISDKDRGLPLLEAHS